MKITPNGFSKFSLGFPSQFQYRIAAFTSSGSLVWSPNYTACTFNRISTPKTSTEVSTRTTEETKSLHHWVRGRNLNIRVDCFALAMTWEKELLEVERVFPLLRSNQWQLNFGTCNVGLKFQILLALRARSILKTRVRFQTKVQSTQFNYHYLWDQTVFDVFLFQILTNALQRRHTVVLMLLATIP